MKERVGYQPIFSQIELDSKDFYKVIGPDTLLFNYQKARGISFELADKYKEFTDHIKTKDGLEYIVKYNACFYGSHYEAHAEYTFT